MPNLLLILLLTGVVHCLDTASYASRIAGARTGRLALTGALFNIVSLASRAAVAYESHGSFSALLLHTLSLCGFSRVSSHLARLL